jgi:hypothetical protein
VGGFNGYHSEWNLGSPGGWDYQRITQKIGKKVWHLLSRRMSLDLELDFDHPMFSPVDGLVDMLVRMHRRRNGDNPGIIAVVAEEETLEDVVENQNLAKQLDRIQGITGALAAPQSLKLENGIVCLEGAPVSVIFMDFNTDVLLSLHRKHQLEALLQAVRENRVLNPRGTEPINVKSMFEVISDPRFRDRFSAETVLRTPWTRQFSHRKTTGPDGSEIADLVEWTRDHWERLVLKPERGYSGKGVHVGGVHGKVDEIIKEALEAKDYIVQEKVPLELWEEEIPELDKNSRQIVINRLQTDFRCLFHGEGLIGFVGRYGHVPTNVGSGGGFQPLAVLRHDVSVQTAKRQIRDAIGELAYADLEAAVQLQEELALADRFTYLLGPVKIALQPRLIKLEQIEAVEDYCAAIWKDCLTLEKMWLSGDLDQMIRIEPEELAIARSQPWGGSPAILASDGLFNFD